MLVRWLTLLKYRKAGRETHALVTTLKQKIFSLIEFDLTFTLTLPSKGTRSIKKKIKDTPRQSSHKRVSSALGPSVTSYKVERRKNP